MAPKSKTNLKTTPNTEDALEDIHESAASIFEQVQLSVANHRKNCVALWKVYARVCGVVDVRHGGGRKGKGSKGDDEEVRVKHIGERRFQQVFLDMVRRVLDVKKGAGAERVIRFVGEFVKFVTEKLSETNNEEEPRFTAALLDWLVQGFQSKDKVVRLRCIQLVGELIAHLGEIEEDTYNNLRSSLIDRLNDKEPAIRALVVAALAKLVGSEDPDQQGEKSILTTLLDVLETDPAAEPRRSALLHIPLTQQTLPYLLRRTRDIDPISRKLVYTSLFTNSKISNPRWLSIAQRELVVRDGLGDREPSVRVAAGKVVSLWFDFVCAEGEGEDAYGWEGDDGGVMKSLVRFLRLFDVSSPGEGEAIAIDAVLSIFTTRGQVLDCFVFDETYFTHASLSPESSLVARIFVEHCIKTNQEANLEKSKVPVISAFAYHLQGAFESYFEGVKRIRRGAGNEREANEEDEEDTEREEEMAKRETVLGNLLKLILCLDYADEIGRRKVFGVVKETLLHPNLPPSLIDPCADVLKAVMKGDDSERDLVRVVVEGVVELREGISSALSAGGDNGREENQDDRSSDDDNSSEGPSKSRAKHRSSRKKNLNEEDEQSLSAARTFGDKNRQADAMKQGQADMIDLRCLLIVVAILERVNGTFESNSTLQGILASLIIPCIKRKTNLPILREKALLALGLCCLIVRESDPDSGQARGRGGSLSVGMVGGSLGLFLSQVRGGEGGRVNEGVKLVCLSVVMDLLVCCLEGGARGIIDERVNQLIEFLLQTLEGEESEEAQGIIVIGFCKLLLAGVIKDARVLLCLLIMYISPLTRSNQRVRQCLAYFFPVYSFASVENQGRVGEIFMKTLGMAFRMYEELEEDEEMIEPEKVGMVMLEWLDPERVFEATNAKEDREILNAPSKPNPQANLAVEILIALYDEERTVDEKKIFLKILGGLKFSGGSMDLKTVKKMDVLLTFLDEQCPLETAVNEKLFTKFRKRIEEEFAEEFEDVRKDGFEDDEEVKEVYRKIGVDVPGEREDGRERRKRVGVKKREESSEEKEDEGDDIAAPPEDEQTNPPTPRPPRRAGRAAKGSSNKGKSRQSPEESDEENIPPSPPPPLPTEKVSDNSTVMATPRKKKGVKRIHTPGSGAINSPKDRKRKRVKADLKKQENTPSETDRESDVESPTTPTKTSARSGWSRGPRSGSQAVRTRAASRKRRAPALGSHDNEDTDEDEAEVASMIASEASEPEDHIRYSSDDLGGYD